MGSTIHWMNDDVVGKMQHTHSSKCAGISEKGNISNIVPTSSVRYLGTILCPVAQLCCWRWHGSIAGSSSSREQHHSIYYITYSSRDTEQRVERTKMKMKRYSSLYIMYTILLRFDARCMHACCCCVWLLFIETTESLN